MEIINFHCFFSSLLIKDFDLCEICKEKFNHEHEMKKFGLDLDRGSSNNLEQTRSKDEQKQLIERNIQALFHASTCSGCSQPSCLKLKETMHHVNGCQQKSTGQCLLCKKFLAFCCYHAKQCNENECPIQICATIKHQLIRKQLAQLKKQEKTLSRRISLMIDGEAQSDSSQDDDDVLV